MSAGIPMAVLVQCYSNTSHHPLHHRPLGAGVNAPLNRCATAPARSVETSVFGKGEGVSCEG